MSLQTNPNSLGKAQTLVIVLNLLGKSAAMYELWRLGHPLGECVGMHTLVHLNMPGM